MNLMTKRVILMLLGVAALGGGWWNREDIAETEPVKQNVADGRQ